MRYRTLLIRRKIEEIPPDQLQRFIEVQEAFRRWATEWCQSGFKTPLPQQNPLRQLARYLKFGMAVVKHHCPKEEGKIWNVPLIFDVQLRVDGERDMSRGVFIDLTRGEVRIRRLCETIVLKLKKSSIKWIKERIEEGGKPVLAMAWVGRPRRSNLVTFNVALVFAREVAPIEMRRVLVVDLNALHNGVAIATIEGERILQRGTLRPDLRLIEMLQKEISRLESLCAKRGEPYCTQFVAAQSRLYRLLRKFEDEAAKKIVRLARQYKALIVVDAPKDESLREIKQSRYDPSKKIYLNVGRLKKRIERLAEWYGVPYSETRLYSTICPRCGFKMKELPGRKMRCPKCGFEAHRDEVPSLWAAKRFSELISSFSSSAIALAVF
ncbi:Transposase-like protein [Pyrobaculum oguniense TE7]|uniref:Transposase-like protein n=1 Tax=Pyrobaculum oguniense (strain DSM 13380 / JCM 10595 / TE7) TaxID=698757 RepID=H6QCY1_PYROT|nr:Transposase-like protein [Pyrobaculum oguniense TE7]